MDTRYSGRRRPPAVAAVQHAIDALRRVSSSNERLGVSELARQLGLHKSTVSRLLATLESAHLIERDRTTNRFGPGIGLLSLAAPLMSSLRLVDIAAVHLRELAAETGETVSLNVWDGDAAVCVQQVQGTAAIQHFAPPGMRNPAHCTAAGKLLLAFAPEADITRLFASGFTRHTETTTTDSDLLHAELALVRDRSYAVNRGEFVADVAAVAGAVRDLEGKVIAALTATVPIYRFSDDRRNALIAQVVNAAGRLSGRLGIA